MERPDDAIKRMSDAVAQGTWSGDVHAIVVWAKSTEGKHVVEWPSESTREHLLRLCDDFPDLVDGPSMNAIRALRALAAIAPQPQRKKRMVNIWETSVGNLLAIPVEQTPNMNHWRKAAGPIEI